MGEYVGLERGLKSSFEKNYGISEKVIRMSRYDLILRCLGVTSGLVTSNINFSTEFRNLRVCCCCVQRGRSRGRGRGSRLSRTGLYCIVYCVLCIVYCVFSLIASTV